VFSGSLLVPPQVLLPEVTSQQVLVALAHQNIGWPVHNVLVPTVEKLSPFLGGDVYSWLRESILMLGDVLLSPSQLPDHRLGRFKLVVPLQELKDVVFDQVVLKDCSQEPSQAFLDVPRLLFPGPVQVNLPVASFDDSRLLS